MLRDSLRGFLEEHWNADAAAKQSAPPEEISSIWTKLVGQGVASLGCDVSEGGLREILVVMAELGRAGCPVPMWSAALANLCAFRFPRRAAVDLAAETACWHRARLPFRFGAFDPDPNAGAVRVADGKASGLLRFVEVAA